jgi:hypothetical protein
MLALMLAYAYPVRLYLTQQAQIQQLQASQAAQRSHIKSLNQQITNWQDDAYVKAQARARFLYVTPGSKAYEPLLAPVPAPTVTPTRPTTPWYGQLWSSVRGADDPGAGPPTPSSPASGGERP